MRPAHEIKYEISFTKDILHYERDRLSDTEIDALYNKLEVLEIELQTGREVNA